MVGHKASGQARYDGIFGVQEFVGLFVNIGLMATHPHNLGA